MPNKVYSLIRAFAANHVRFHAADGGGYAFLADQVLALDGSTRRSPRAWRAPSTAGRSSTQNRQAKAQEALERIRDTDKLSSDVGEIVSKALA